MKEDIHQCMKMGIVHRAAFPLAASKRGGTIESMMDIVRDPFFDAIELTSIPDPAERTEVTQLLLSSGMMVCYHAQPRPSAAKPLSIGSLIERERRSAIQELKEAIDEASEMHAEMVTISDEFISGAFLHKNTLPALEQSLQEIGRYAASKGAMKAAYEPPFTFSNEPPRETIAKIPGTGVYIDVEHLPAHYEMNDRNMKHVKKQLIYSRIGNCSKDGRYQQHVAARQQAVNTEQLMHFLRNLCKMDYIGEGKQKVLALGVKPLAGESPQAVIAGGKRTLLEAWRLLQRHSAIWPEC
ncbi:sugar phosphate isomerase/epimerase family protein [Paenibacillus cremeus]|uniref:Xylose isomerase-like TIM barrel domain-containing protein n=1 Tax=Paenibacillus cremeus TaxID=2163881 RepID=A0A559KAR6_9BACL|nr:TIM barrel protein [Paenibacillus cremeus]TVY09216.1 hypothetical protein FPZ49_14855 [Paenibacillus cremeus]